MLDFLIISIRKTKNGIEVYPNFKILNPSQDLMIRGRDFYAIWVEELGLWSTNEQDVIDLIDRELYIFTEDLKKNTDENVKTLYMWDSESRMIDTWHRYCQQQMRDSFHMLDEKLIFSNDPTNKKDYASKRLNYPLEFGSTTAWDELISTLYSPAERHKLEWAIGSIVSGESKHIQKFMVLYGAAGTGKSTMLNIIQQLFEGYYSVFDAKALGSSSNSFALEPFKTNPLVAIQHDGDLSRIEDNTRLNSLVSHELMTVNEKFKATYANQFKCFLFMGTNKPVKITDAKSGLIRRLIDVRPSGNKLSPNVYRTVMKQIEFELGSIANYCRDVYLNDPGYYDDYIPTEMMGASNDFYNFVIDSYHIFEKEDSTTLKAAWEMYKLYCEEARVQYALAQRAFKEELKNYFWDYTERFTCSDGSRIRNWYSRFRVDRFEGDMKSEKKDEIKLIDFNSTVSIFDDKCADCTAQYASERDIPLCKWDEVLTKLSSLDTSKVHFVKVPENHIVIDFDIKDENGNKSYELNRLAASRWPATYAELSKSGSGIHLHYIYTGDPSKLSRIYDENIEIKVFVGNSSLRRRLTKCNDIPIANISSGLPLKEDSRLINKEVVQTEKGIRTTIKKCLNKEVHPSTKPNIDFIHDILDKAYASGLVYDVTDMKNAVIAFAAQSSNQSDYCMKLVTKMNFKSEEPFTNIGDNDSDIAFYDVEVFPNLFLVNWKIKGEGNPIVRMINPTTKEIEQLLNFRLIGFNCRRYDNHMLYARLIGYTNEQLYGLSQKIINSHKGAKGVFFGEAYNLSYTDIYDFASAGNKKSLKKLEIEMGIHHKELGLPWDEPVPEEQWIEVAEYCDNDVIATEAAFEYLNADWTARQILADLAEMTVNDTTNTLTTKIIFGNNRNPQNEFNYRNMAEPVHELADDIREFLKEACPIMMAQPFGDECSILPYFPGYTYDFGKSLYCGEVVSEGGYVYAEPGMYVNVALLDVSSMHPHSAIAECLFGPRFTKAFRDIVEGRVDIKHEAWETMDDILDGKLAPYVKKVINGEMTSGDLADALKTAINSVYGLTFASFDNPFHDKRNVDNIVAKRGALFMVDLKLAVMELGFEVAHIKTDSIKIPNATPEIIKFVMDFGERYGYSFEHEATYERMCLVNDAVYIAKFATSEYCENAYGYVPKKCAKKGGTWTATGTQFQIPYVFKNLFSKEPIEFDDMCETKSVSTALYLDMNDGLPDVSEYELELDKIRKDREKASNNGLCIPMDRDMELNKLIAEGHNYIFVGKVGRFCPVENGGGELVRQSTDKLGNIKFASASGAKGYRWLESETVRASNHEHDIDRGYYDKMVDDAVSTISKYGDFEWFISDNDDSPPWDEDSHFEVR